MSLPPKHKRIIIKAWVYPLITLFLMGVGVILYYIMTPDTTGNLLLSELALGFFMLILTCGAIINLIRGLYLFVKYRQGIIAKHLALALLLLCVVIAIPSGNMINKHLHQNDLKRHNQAVGEIRQIHWALEAYSADQMKYPTEEQGLKILDESDFYNTTPVDPWGSPYHYRLKRPDGSDSWPVPYVWSSGKDGQPETSDDIDKDSPRRTIHYYHYPAP